MENSKLFRFRFIVSLLLFFHFTIGCDWIKSNFSSQTDNNEETSDAFIQTFENKVGVIETKFGKIIIAFFPSIAPKHVANFDNLAESGFYNGTTFHRVIPGFMIQGGDPLSKDPAKREMHGRGGPGYGVEAEFSDRKHVRGIVSAARAQDPNSAGSQFFIMVAPAPPLDGQYSIFGRVIHGMDNVDKIVASKRDKRDNPLHPVTMNVSLLTFEELQTTHGLSLEKEKKN